MGKQLRGAPAAPSADNAVNRRIVKRVHQVGRSLLQRSGVVERTAAHRAGKEHRVIAKLGQPLHSGLYELRARRTCRRDHANARSWPKTPGLKDAGTQSD